MTNSVSAQNRNELWARINITSNISPRLSIGLDVSHRRNADMKNDALFHYGLSNIARLWGYYKPTDKWTLMLSPLAYFDNHSTETATGKIVHLNEVRIMAGVSRELAFEKIKNNNRFLYELSYGRYLGQYTSSRQRFRLQNNLIIPLWETDGDKGIQYQFYNEIFFKTQHEGYSFDQDRVYNGLRWKPDNYDLNAGYQLNLQKSGDSWVYKNQFLVTMNVHL
ncbi:MAG TPA: DUF2490 domain-containing protein [Chitinophagaceae bacterium]